MTIVRVLLVMCWVTDLVLDTKDRMRKLFRFGRMNYSGVGANRRLLQANFHSKAS